MNSAIVRTFNDLDLGEIQNTDFTPCSYLEGTPYNLVHIKWNINDQIKDHTKDFLNRGAVVNDYYSKIYINKKV